MKYSLFRLISTLLFALAISLSVVTSGYAQLSNHDVATEETKEMNCCSKMDKMQEEMKMMMDKHSKMMSDMSSLFKELQQTGKLTQEQIKKMQNIEQMMKQMEEKMKRMSTMGNDNLK